MRQHIELSSDTLHQLIRKRTLTLAGNRTLKIYGNLRCASGKSMKKKNRVFFLNEAEALTAGYRPCGNCMSPAFRQWKLSKKQVE
jgi:methylphosphotriester-DNA--protein-cysteine methyltransferase